MAADKTPYVTGLFADRDSAERAYQDALDRGYDKDDMNLVMSDETRKRHFSAVSDGAGIVAGIGGTVGPIAAGLAAVGTMS